MATRKKKPGFMRRTYSPNQIVAYNVARARTLRGWTQEQAATALAPYLGTKWSNASFSAVERSIAGLRVKHFSADELVALARGFELPLGWFLLPPPPDQDAGLATADAKARGNDMGILLDVILGTETTLPPWRDALNTYAAECAKAVYPTAPAAGNDTAVERLATLAELRAAVELRETFGNTTEARDVLTRLANLLDRLDDHDDGKSKSQTKRSGSTKPK
jgi:transcriptional regulator with XRE-family HTH domain